jgi:predicted NAD/FAD-binding protein
LLITLESIGIGAHGFTLDVGDGKTAVTLDVPHRIVNLRYYADLVNFLYNRGLEFQKEVLQMAYSDVEYGPVLQYHQVKVLGAYFPSFPLNTIFSHPGRYLHLLYDTIFFYRRAKTDLKAGMLQNMTLGQYFDYLRSECGYTSVLLDSIILPLLSVATTADFDSVKSMPADIPIHYVTSGIFSMRKNDGGMFRPVGGVPQISAVLSAPLKDIRTETQITKITKLENGKLSVSDSSGTTEVFDHIILATQANQALKLVGHIDEEYASLGDIKHTLTKVVVHKDPIVMGPYFDPRYSFHLLANRTTGQAMASVWMNPSMPQLPFDVHQTTNPIVPLDESAILFQHTFERPLIDMAAAAAIKVIQRKNGNNNIWFCGSYSLYGMPLLENGAQSAFKVVEALTGRRVHIPPRPEKDTLLRRVVALALIGTTVAATAFLVIKKMIRSRRASRGPLEGLLNSLQGGIRSLADSASTVLNRK